MSEHNAELLDHQSQPRRLLKGRKRQHSRFTGPEIPGIDLGIDHRCRYQLEPFQLMNCFHSRIVSSMSLNLQEDWLGCDNLSGPLPEHLQETHAGEKDQGRCVHKSPAEQVQPPPSARRHRREKRVV